MRGMIEEYRWAFGGVACWSSFTRATKKKEVALFYDGNTLFQLHIGEQMIRVNTDISSQSYYSMEEEVLLWPCTWMTFGKVEFDPELNKHIISLSL